MLQQTQVLLFTDIATELHLNRQLCQDHLETLLEVRRLAVEH